MKKAIYSAFILTIVIISLVIGGQIIHKAEEVAISASSEGIKWVDFSVPKAALDDALSLDISTSNSENHIPIYQSLAYLAAKNYGSFKSYKKGYLTSIENDLFSLSEKMAENKLYNYYLKAYGALLSGFVGNYTKISASGETENGYGLRVFSPIAEGFYYRDYDDFGASRSYGYKRSHLGHDMLGSVGTPIIAVESGRVEAVGWNQYGGWRIGIRSFDGLRYYYYAHLRKDHPYNDIYEGKIVNAGEVIGYLGMTGYSSKENTNNIDTPHLHFGIELIFSPEQKDGYNQIWIDCYAISQFLFKNRSEVVYNKETKEYNAKYYYSYPEAPD